MPKKKAPVTKAQVKEDEVDKIIEKLDGRIPRKRDPKLCRHDANGGCQHCSPLEPWDQKYLDEKKIKHLSFHSYIRKLSSGPDKGKYLTLEDIVNLPNYFNSDVHTFTKCDLNFVGL